MTRLATASLGRRLLALVYESLLVGAVTFVAFLAAAPLDYLLRSWPSLTRIATGIIFLGAWWLYFGTTWRKKGQTLPMKVWHIGMQQNNGNHPSPQQLRMRYLWAVLFLVLIPALAYIGFTRNAVAPLHAFGLSLLWWILPWGFALLHPDRQFLYDYLAGTRLVRTA